jgi:hypothetical protein
MMGLVLFIVNESADLNPLRILEIYALSCFYDEPIYFEKQPPDRLSKSKNKHPLKSDQLLKIESLYSQLSFKSRIFQGFSVICPSLRMEQLIDNSLDFEFEKTIILAEKLNSTISLSVTPQVIMARAAHHQRCKSPQAFNFLLDVAISIISNEDVLLEYSNSAFKNNLSIAFKRMLVKITQHKRRQINVAEHDLFDNFQKSLDRLTLDANELTCDADELESLTYQLQQLEAEENALNSKILGIIEKKKKVEDEIVRLQTSVKKRD